jgi:hypothetical protein
MAMINPVFHGKLRRRGASLALAVLFAGSLGASAAWAQAAAQPAQPASGAQSNSQQAGKAAAASAQPAAKAAAAPAKAAGAPSRYLPSRFAGRAGVFYKTVWGIDSLSVKWAESGELIRFTWRVLDPERARPLNDKKIEPALIDQRAGVSLVVPTMEKVGQLRQSQRPEAGRSYWMAFSNRGRVVKRGDRVDVVIGPFRAENLVVD